ncbi:MULTISPECIES: hypothetical protein [Lysinibacillus]|uniref:hypothetical protein n=1 Tax=Lysinibacillus TaxID=400634 RepID=UPI00214C5EFA|nr:MULTISPECIES: hypothetical protein [Lysinibacillus]UUV25902.1 hypothetical protein NP781_04600 [Lysinibacillus sp. FN11]UYB48775.1 hypothetical protein OCI51_07390 [Lysinibacillus capsici]
MNILELVNKSPYSCDLAECEFLLNHYKGLDNFYDFDMKIRALERQIKKLTKPKTIPQWELDAIEYIKLTEKWESLGCYFKSNEYYCKWYYKDKEFYMWWSGSHISDNIIKAREADKLLDEMIFQNELYIGDIPDCPKELTQEDVTKAIKNYTEFVNKNKEDCLDE